MYRKDKAERWRQYPPQKGSLKMINVIVNEDTAELMLNGDFDTLIAELMIEIAAIADRLTTNKKEFEKFKFIITEMINSVDYEKIKNEIQVE